jgi:hypothetical protein
MFHIMSQVPYTRRKTVENLNSKVLYSLLKYSYITCRIMEIIIMSCIPAVDIGIRLKLIFIVDYELQKRKYVLW